MPKAGVCIECGNDNGTNSTCCMLCASFYDGVATARARIVAMLRMEAEDEEKHRCPGYDPCTRCARVDALKAMADRIELDEQQEARSPENS